MIRNYGALPEYLDEIIPARCEICQEVVERSSDYAEDNWNEAIATGRLKQCRDCGRWVCDDCWDDEMSVCKICKREIPSLPICPSCGHQNQYGAKFCSQCASSLGDGTRMYGRRR